MQTGYAGLGGSIPLSPARLSYCSPTKGDNARFFRGAPKLPLLAGNSHPGPELSPFGHVAPGVSLPAEAVELSQCPSVCSPLKSMTLARLPSAETSRKLLNGLFDGAIGRLLNASSLKLWLIQTILSFVSSSIIPYPANGRYWTNMDNAGNGAKRLDSNP